MRLQKLFLVWFLLLTVGMARAQVSAGTTESVYQLKPNDPEALFFTPENFNIKADGVMDVSDSLQAAINRVKREKSFGILFIPEGKYRISRTIYVPGAVRLIGYGKARPEFILGKNTPGYQVADEKDKGKANYMFWFTGGIVTDPTRVGDAGAGTFYSAVSNVNFTIQDGNPVAIALRTHFAQHGFVSHCIINAGKGKAGLLDVGNEMENVRFLGGDYGIITNRTSPGWPMMMVDTYFEGQRKAAIQTNEGGLAIVNMHVKNTPVAVEMVKDRVDRLFMENCILENIKESAVVVSVEDNTLCQLNMLNIDCSNVPVLVKFQQSGKKVESADKMYKVKEFVYGLIINDLASDSKIGIINKIEPLKEISKILPRDVPALPSMDTWVSVRDFGAKGDGLADDTKAFRDAIAAHKNIYVPSGWYRITETIKMAPGTKLIGLHPFATQILITESEPAFSGFGAPKPLVESSEGGDDMLNGIGINTGAYNYRAVGCKWMAGEKSLMNDVKYVGGHGTMRKPNPNGEAPRTGGQRPGMGGTSNISSPTNPVRAQGMDLAWDNQYWSLWVTNNGGGTLKDIWTANTYAANGFYVSNTSTPGRVYAMSLEHHVRNEARFSNVSNWKMYAFQFEEEGTEGKDCMMMEISNSKNLLFANQWMYRVIRVNTPQAIGVRVWNSENIEFRNLHNYTQKLQVVEFPIYDFNKQLPAYAWDFAKLAITGKEPGKNIVSNQPWKVNKIASGFIFGLGATSDSKGNFYFCEHDRKRIYKWSAETNTLNLLAEYPWKPFSLAFDTKDNLLVVFRYDPQPGFKIGDKQETVKRLPDDNPMYSGWGNSGWGAWMYSVNPNNPDETFKRMPLVATKDIKNLQKAFYPASRWRSDFNTAMVFRPDSSFLAPDGVTYLPETYDLGRCSQLTAVYPGKPFFASDELQKRIVKTDVGFNGELSNLQEVYRRGEYATATDSNGNLYVADGQIFVFDKNGKEVRRIDVEERPISMAFGGKDKKTLFVTTRTSLFSVVTE